VLERLNCRTLLPEASIDHQVTGAFVASMPYSESRNTFVDLITHQFENCKIDSLPFYSQDPIITVAMPESYKQIMGLDTPRMQKIREYLGEDVSNQLRSDALELDPLSTIYIPRKSFTNTTGVSYYRRILPLWLLEKNLFRGTLVESARRQRGILHLTLGDGDQWEPTIAEMQAAMELFQNADADPLGAVIATRMGIDSQEIRQGGDFWKVTDLWDQTSQAKLRALMVSEAFLSGEACMVGSTLIPTEERGLVRIDELCSPEQKDRKMHDIDITVSGRYSKLKAEKWLYNGRRKTMRVTTDLGNVLTCTPNHPLLVLDDDGLGTSWVRTDRVKIGDYLCVPVRRIVRTTPLELNLSEHMEYPSKGHNGKQLTRPEYMTPELAYFIGMFIAEGNWSNGDTRLNISNTDTALLSRCVESVSKVFGLDVDIHKSKRFVKGAKYCVNGNEGTLNKDVYSIRIHSKQLVKWFEELGVYPTRGEKSMSHYKDVPWSILQADVKSQCAFLAAYLEGDGHIHHSGRIQWISVSRKVLSKIQLMLQSMGYIAARSGRKVSLGYLDSENLMDELMPYMDSKFILYYKERKARNSYYLPDLTVRSLMKERKVRDTRYGSYFLNDDGEEILIQGYKKRNDRNFLYDCVDSGKYDVALAALAEVSSDTHEKLSHMLSLRYRYVKVTSIDEGKVRDVYDISMGDQEPAFVANGCIVHNTYSTGDTGLTVFIEYMRSYRDMMTNRMFYNKIFPLISALNGFTLNDRGKLTVRGNMLDKFDVMRNHEVLQDGSRLLIPSVHWTKSLKPEGDATYMDMLQQLTDKGVPVPIRAMAAAGGFNLESLLASQEDDFELIKRVGTYQKKIEELKKEYMPEGSGDESAMAAVASDLMRREIQRATGTRSDVLSYNNGKMVGLADRTYPEEMMEVPGEMKGKKRWLYNQRRANERANRKIAEQLEEVTRRQRSHLTHETVSPRKLSV
jgi:intein/homing endonuclease